MITMMMKMKMMITSVLITLMVCQWSKCYSFTISSIATNSGPTPTDCWEWNETFQDLIRPSLLLKIQHYDGKIRTFFLLELLWWGGNFVYRVCRTDGELSDSAMWWGRGLCSVLIWVYCTGVMGPTVRRTSAVCRWCIQYRCWRRSLLQLILRRLRSLSVYTCSVGV